MKKKRFTLIELLAVIIILAIIVVITTPIIVKKIEDAKYGSFKRSVEEVVRSLELEHAKNGYVSTSYSFPLKKGESIDSKGNFFNWEGKMTLSDTFKLTIFIKNENYCAMKNEEDEFISYDKENCNNLEA